MSARTFLLVALGLVGAAFLWLAGQGGPLAQSTDVRADSVEGRAAAELTILAGVDPALGDAVATGGAAVDRQSLGRDSAGDAAATSAEKPAELRRPDRLRWVDELTQEPVPFVRFALADQAGKTFEGASDAEGWYQVPRAITPGPVSVTVLWGARMSESLFDGPGVSGTLEGYVLAAGAGSTAAGSSAGSSIGPAIEAGPKDCVWRFPAERLVALRVSMEEDDSTQVSLHRADVWISCEGADTGGVWIKHQLEQRWRFGHVVPELCLGATHAIRMPSVTEPVSRRLTLGRKELSSYPACWTHERTGMRMGGCRLLLVSVVDGKIYASDGTYAELPRLGERPLELTLRPQLPSQLPGEVLPGFYAADAALQQQEIDRVESEKARPVFQLEGVLRSNSGTYQGQVAIRANPAERNKEGGYDLRQQWITAEWKEVQPQWFEAPFKLNRLDGGPYTVLFIPQDGTAVSERRIAVDTTAPGLGPLVVTVLD